jgi:asparagine synthase (glutamine-hydrolysing)
MGMCGISGTFGFANPTTSMAMRDALGHRGPDESASWTSPDGRCALDFRRLSIVDVAHGQQPFTDPTKQIRAVVNGEIYNHPSLRAELGTEQFTTASDAEVVAHLYARDGLRGLEQLDGMFALLVHDGARDTFAAMRDRYGIKPLWYVHKPDGAHGWRDRWWFASEAKALHAGGADVSRIRRLPPGHLLTPTGERRWYRLTPRQVPSFDDPEVLHALLDASVRRHLMADETVGIGVFLSGGLDSSAVAALAARHRPDIIAFTIGAERSPDVAAARLVAEHLGIKHVVVPLDLDELYAALPDAVAAIESYNPMVVVEGAVQSVLARVARHHGVTVALVGEGADEIGAGYGVFRSMPRNEVPTRMRGALSRIGDTEAKRVDLATMRHGVEARPVFLDPMVAEHVLNLPLSALLHEHDGRLWEKWAIRRAVQHLLPRDVVWRPKTSFDEGSGALQVLRRVRAAVPDHVFAEAQSTYPQAQLASKEAAFFHESFVDAFGNMGGGRVFELFGSYPLLDPVVAARDLDAGGTGEGAADLAELHRSTAALTEPT